MLYVQSLDGLVVEPIINIADDFSIEQSINGDFSINFTTFKSDKNIGYEFLKNENDIIVDDYIFTIKRCSENKYSKTILGVSKFFNNSKKQISNIFSGSHSLTNHLNFILSGTGWSYKIDPDISNQVNYIDSFGDGNVIELLEKIKEAHDIEYVILKGYNLIFSKRIGNDEDFQLRYKYNVNDVSSDIDTSSLYTFIKGTGAEGISASYTSPNASIFGILEDSSISDERFTSVSSLTQYLKSKINDTPNISIESNSTLLTERSTGENVWLIYEPLELEMQTRIISQTKKLIDGILVTSSVVLGNSQKKSTIDLAVSQQQEILGIEKEAEETKNQFRSEIKVTNDRITLEVEEIDRSIAAIDIKSDNINLSVNNRITNEVAMIDIRADGIESSVSNLDMRTSSSITQLYNNINLKIDVGGAITDINLSPGVATINADKINLNGAVIVNGSISGATDIITRNNVAVGNALYFGGVMGSIDFIEINSGMEFNSTRFDFYGTGGMYVNGNRVLTTLDL